MLAILLTPKTTYRKVREVKIKFDDFAFPIVLAILVIGFMMWYGNRTDQYVDKIINEQISTTTVHDHPQISEMK